MPEPAAHGPGKDDWPVPFARVAGLVRHLTHDFRNGLNGIDLQAAFVHELASPESEALPEIKRLRAMIVSTAKTLHNFSASFWLPEAQFVTYDAKIIVEDVRSRLATVLPEGAPEFEWEEQLGSEQISVDLEMIFRAFSEFFKNAAHFREDGRPSTARVHAEGDQFVLELREPKAAVASPPETWGMEPLVSTRRGGYGMGLFYARRVLAAHGGTATFSFDPAAQVLTTRVTLPLARA